MRAMTAIDLNPQAGVRLLQIGPEDAGQRIDNYLLRQLKGVPRSFIYRILRRGEVRVNRGRIKAEYRLKDGDQVRVPPVRTAAPAPKAERGDATARLEQCILYEDERLLVIDKPAGMAVHGGELVHRLDRETSGCLLIAKKRSELRRLHELLRAGRVEKRYLALVLGRWQTGERRVDAPLRKNQLRGGERIVTVTAEGKAADTLFRPLDIRTRASLMEIALGTGRTHQIRVHSAHVGHPLAGDEKYGDGEFNRQMRGLGLKRLFLHAHSIAYGDPDNGRDIHVSSPLPEELRAVLDRLSAGDAEQA